MNIIELVKQLFFGPSNIQQIRKMIKTSKNKITLINRKKLTRIARVYRKK